jgi:hypothetical protein
VARAYLHEFPFEPNETPEQRLALWVLGLAVVESLEDMRARAWLLTSEAAWWAQLAGFQEWPSQRTIKLLTERILTETT